MTTVTNSNWNEYKVELRAYVNDSLNSLSKKFDTSMDFIRLLGIVDALVPNSAVDLDQIYRNINLNVGASKTDYYAQDGDHDDEPTDDERTGSCRSESQTSKNNDFSRFRRHTSTFVVKRWMPSDDAVYRIVCNKLFGGAESELDAFLRSASDVRHRCLKLLCYRPDYNESVVQNVFVMFLLTILGPMRKWCVLPIMGRSLSATIPIKGVDPNDLSVIYENQTLKGFADVGIFARGTEKTANQPRVVVEIKKWLRGARAYQPKDQLIVEMEASRQAQARGTRNTTKAEKFVRGCLTDMFALNIAIADTTDSSVVFYMAQRVCAHRSYLLRLLFLLCENVSRSDWTPLLVETPVAVPTAGVVTRGNAARQVAPPQNCGIGSPKEQLPGKKNAASARKRAGHLPWQEREVVLNFKEEDELEEQEEHYRSLLSMALRWQGINHLCAETLAEASKAAQAAANDNIALPMAAWAAQR